MHRDPWIPAEDRAKVFRLFGCSLSPLACSRSVRPKGAKGDSPGQSEAPPRGTLARREHRIVRTGRSVRPKSGLFSRTLSETSAGSP
jgi:hypothetical protein